MACLPQVEQDAPLVSTSISHRPSKSRGRLPRPTGIELLPFDALVKRDFGPQPQPPHLQGLTRGNIEIFSGHSASRLVQTASNAMPQLVSQFCLTYHEASPDGPTCKKHLDAWLKALKRASPGVGYLWILEFQTRGVPHFHVWLTEPYSEKLWKCLGAAWNRIAEPGSEKHLWWHTEARVDPATGKLQRSYMAWEMKGAGYLRKYMSKKAQKAVPEGFKPGRFWGSTRDLVPDAIKFAPEDLPAPIEDITRILSKWKESKRRRAASMGRKIAKDKGRKHQAVKLRPTARGVSTSARLNGAAMAFWELMSHFKT